MKTARYLAATLVMLHATLAFAVWHDADAPFRRAITLELPEAKITGEERVMARLLLNGKQKADASDVRVLTIQGKEVPYRIVQSSQGDQVEITFNTLKGTRVYHAYFGATKPRKPPSEALNKGGLLMEVKAGANVGASQADLMSGFDRGARVIGSRMIPRPHLGNNLVGHTGATTTRITGHLFAPIDGSYLFAVAGDDRVGLWIAEKPVVFARQVVADARFQERVTLKRGWHPFTVHHADFGGEYRLGVYWQRPDTNKLEPIGNEFFGPLIVAEGGVLESREPGMTADLRATYLGESFYANRYAHRYRFDVASSLRAAERMQVSWHFADGRTATGQQVEHVFLHPGVHAVRVETKLGAQTDAQTFHLHVDRDYERADRPPVDELGLHARLLRSYELSKLTPQTLAHAVLMFLRTDSREAAFKAGAELVRQARHENRPLAFEALSELYEDAMERNAPAEMERVYAAAAKESNLHPRLAAEHASLLMYGMGEFSRALDVIAPVASSDDTARRAHAQALLLNGELAKARAILSVLPVGASPQKVQALSGAMARTTEFHVREKNTSAGEEAWEKWMAAFPADFLEGNAALLRVRLIENRKLPEVAARVAESYANANPTSAYSPRLLHEAARLLEKSDAAKAQQLRELLQQRYPEDPLSAGR